MSNESEHLYSYITIVLDELYTEFFKQVFKVELLSTKQGHEDKDLGCFCKCSLPYKTLVFFLFKEGFEVLPFISVLNDYE